MAIVNKDLTQCEDGEFRIRVLFGVNTLVQRPQFNEYEPLFCINEVSFWKDNVINPVWPVGDRAVYGVRGPVKMLKRNVLIDNKKKQVITEFDRNGTEVFREGTTVDDCTIGERKWSPQGDIIIEYTARSYQGGTHKMSYWRRYDEKGRLIASGQSCAEKNEEHDCGLMWGLEEPCPGFTGSFSYMGNDFLQASLDPGGQGYTIAESFGYEKGQLKSVHTSYTTHGGGDFKTNTVYTILAVDKYGNWTKRKCDVEILQDSVYYGSDDGEDVHYKSYTEERTIIYY